LLSAGLAAERAGELERARKLYEDAAQKAANPLSALWCLARLAAGTGDSSLRKLVQRKLAQLELSRAEPGIECVLASELFPPNGPGFDPTAALVSTLENPKLAPHAALALSLAAQLPEETRDRALDVLEGATEGNERALILREQLGRALLAGEHHARILDLSEDLLRLAPDDVWAAFVRCAVPLPHDEDGHADALLALAECSADPRFKHALQAEALWVRRLVRGGALADAPSPAAEDVGLAQVVYGLAAPRRDAELRASALHTLQAEAPEDVDVQLALARAELARGDARAAAAAAERVLIQVPDEVSALELKRVASRAAGEYAAAAVASEALAQLVGDDFALTLLEESAQLRADALNDPEGAERLLTRVLSRAPTRKAAYARLHDLLRKKSDTGELVALVRSRTDHVHDAEELVKLFFELARLHRARGELTEALDAVDNVLMLEENVGALAL
ncbi:MAG TPA: hypothetical protein VFZ61_22660, partial [Polyangiales bacterium]